VIHRAAAMPVYRRAVRPLPPRSQRRGDRALDGVLEIVNRVHRPPGPLDGLRRHRSLHRTTWMHGTADAARNEEPSQEAHVITVQARKCEGTARMNGRPRRPGFQTTLLYWRAPPLSQRGGTRAYVTVRIQAMTRRLARIDGLLGDLHRGARCPGQPIRQQKEPQPPRPPCPAN
jgi:hypothetical protein